MARLEGKVCLITGASSGIGAKAAQMFAKEGAKVVLAARRLEKLEAVVKKIKAAGGEAIAVKTDIRDSAQAQALVDAAVEAYGRLDVLVNDAGQLVHGLAPVDDFGDEELDKIVNVNLKGTMYVSRAATKVMAGQGSGNVINVSSVSAVTGCGSAVYTATKGAIISLTKHIALRYAYKSPTIRCNCVCPGTVWTDMTKRELASQKDYSPAANEYNSSIGKHSCGDVGICKAEDIANILLFLASDESRCINGQVITADCGCNL